MISRVDDINFNHLQTLLIPQIIYIHDTMIQGGLRQASVFIGDKITANYEHTAPSPLQHVYRARPNPTTEPRLSTSYFLSAAALANTTVTIEDHTNQRLKPRGLRFLEDNLRE